MRWHDSLGEHLNHLKQEMNLTYPEQDGGSN